MPKSKNNQSLQQCQYCKFQSTNVWNHIMNSKECKQFYTNNGQIHVQPINTPQLQSSLSNQSKKGKKNNHHDRNNELMNTQPSTSHALFGQYIPLSSITPLNNTQQDAEIDFTNSHDNESTENIDDLNNDINPTQLSNQSSSTLTNLPIPSNDFTELSANMHELMVKLIILIIV